MMVKLEIRAMKFQLLCTSHLEIVCKFCVFFFFPNELCHYGKKGLCVWINQLYKYIFSSNSEEPQYKQSSYILCRSALAAEVLNLWKFTNHTQFPEYES